MKTNRIGAAVAVAFSVLLFCSTGLAATSPVPEVFQGSDEDSNYAISYDNLNVLLNATVLDIGRSNREKAPRQGEQTGTRLKVKVNRWTVNEGNRFYYEAFVDNVTAQRQLEEIKAGIENATAGVGLKRFPRSEQLAYWLNLYNVTILNELVRIYPQSDLEKFLYGRDSILDKKLLVVEGVALSLNDIQHTILKQNYDGDPLVLYGLYQGVIGGPNIRKNAYTGKTVYDDLTENAIVFINSNRGTAIKNAKEFRASSFYRRNAAFFPDFDADLRAHLSRYLEGDELAALEKSARLRADISDWTITDLGGSRREVGGSLANNSAAMMGAVRGGSSSNYGVTASSGEATSGGINSALAEQARENKDKAGDDADAGNR